MSTKSFNRSPIAKLSTSGGGKAIYSDRYNPGDINAMAYCIK